METRPLPELFCQLSWLMPNSREQARPSSHHRKLAAAARPRVRGCQRWLPAAVLPFPLCDRNSLTLTLADQLSLSLELSKRPMTLSNRVDRGESSPGEGQVFPSQRRYGPPAPSDPAPFSGSHRGCGVFGILITSGTAVLARTRDGSS
jgi:hypothetical protein